MLLNGQPHGFFLSTRGVKLEDPLSFVLFILSMEVLSRELNKLFANKDFKGFKMPKWRSHLNHLAYVDVTIIVTSAQRVFRDDHENTEGV